MLSSLSLRPGRFTLQSWTCLTTKGRMGVGFFKFQWRDKIVIPKELVWTLVCLFMKAFLNECMMMSILPTQPVYLVELSILRHPVVLVRNAKALMPRILEILDRHVMSLKLVGFSYPAPHCGGHVYQPLRFTGFEERIWICFIWSVLPTSGA